MPVSVQISLIALGVLGSFGLLALVSPSLFAEVARRSGKWVDSQKVLAYLDKQVDIDSYVLPHSRMLGISVLLAVASAAWLLIR